MGQRHKIKQTLMNIKNNSSTGYILEYLEYSKELHDIHNDYPLTPEKNYYAKRMVT